MLNVMLTIWRILTYGIGRRRAERRRYRDLASWLEDDQAEYG